MIKGVSQLYPFVMQDSRGMGRAGLIITMKISKDGGAFTETTNAVSAVDATNAPGLYSVQLTATECNCNRLITQVSVSTGENPVVLDIIDLETDFGGATARQVWEYPDGRTITGLPQSFFDAINSVKSGMLHWQSTNSTLTVYNDSNQVIGTYVLTRDSNGIITAVEPS